MRHVSGRVLGLLVVSLLFSACSRKPDEAPPVATPSVSLERSDVAIGSPVEMRYRFQVAANAPEFSEPYWVFVHFLDADGELLWTDDHEPHTPTVNWKAGQTIDYTRTMFIPKTPDLGETHVEIGLFSPTTGERLPLEGNARGMRAYRVATMNVRSEPDHLFVIFRDGWYDTEVEEDGSGVQWQWSKREATLSFRNPRRDVIVFLQLDQPVRALPAPQQVSVSVGMSVVDTFALAPGPRELRRLRVSAAQLGDDEAVEMKIGVDTTFVPAAVPQLKSRDARELGVRVFRAYVQPAP